MKFIVDKNCTGKTRAIIKQSLDNDIPIFALYLGKAESLKEKSLSYFNKVVRVVTPQDFVDGYSGPILVDDLDKAFQSLLATHVNSSEFTIAGATLTED
jgi:hypothetical protein